jgi:CBS domain containing-hemolysin-like protein
MSTTRSLSLKPVPGLKLGAPGGDPWLVSRADSAHSVMTDFHERSAVVVPAESPIDSALEHLKHTGVRSAFVISSDKQHVRGMITAYDIQGDKPIRHLQSVDGNHRSYSRDDVLVQDIMETIEEWQVADMKDIERSSIEMVLKLFKETGRTHIAVIEKSDEHGARLRGMFSAAKIMRLLKD